MNEPRAVRQPTFSVLIPTYQRESVVGRAIDSALRQTDPDLEVIVVDDGSTDGTPQVVAARRDARVRFIQFSENRGVGAARNSAIMSSRGRYLIFLDSDDELVDDALATMREAWRQETDPMIGQQVFRIANADTGTVLGRLDGDGVLLDYLDLLCQRNGAEGDFNGPFRREAFDDPPFESEIRGFEGLAWLRMRQRWTTRGHQRVVYLAHRNRSDQRLSGADSRIRESASLAEGYRRLLVEHGDAMREHCRGRLEGILRRAVVYAVVAGDRRSAATSLTNYVQRYGMPVSVIILGPVILMGRAPAVVALRLRDRVAAR
jgi:Glycosyltransferases involved in cell wall biogenesis